MFFCQLIPAIMQLLLGVRSACDLQAYCTGHLPGMRIQIIGQQVYVVGRPDSFMSGACASQNRSVVIAGRCMWEVAHLEGASASL